MEIECHFLPLMSERLSCTGHHRACGKYRVNTESRVELGIRANPMSDSKKTKRTYEDTSSKLLRNSRS